MKNIRLLAVVLLAISFTLNACTSKVYTAKVPPGQAKKITGSKSAKPFAPGQVKKQNKKKK